MLDTSQINIPMLVWFVISRDSVPKTRAKLSQNHEIKEPKIFHMRPPNKMKKILLYQLFVPNKKAFLQFFPQTPLNATFGHPFFVLFSHPGHTYHIDCDIDLLW